jgi:bifunctional DNA-binding transcriptional regulator/antitoxin component of YhaV-PrlF toxin-antitoxin module
MAMAARLVISKGGQVSVPASIRKRWGTRHVMAEDHGDHIVLRPAPADPVAAAIGVFEREIRALGSEDAKRLDREEELDAEQRNAEGT